MAHFTKLISLSLKSERGYPLPHKNYFVVVEKRQKENGNLSLFSVKAISRADGRSAIAAAAYRSGEKIDRPKTTERAGLHKKNRRRV